jgi:hypothetical protein
MDRVEFWQIDGGPSGTWWEAPYEDVNGATAWDTDDKMLVAARQAIAQGYTVRFRTQAEYELRVAAGMED